MALCGATCEAELEKKWIPPLDLFGVNADGLTALEQLAVAAAVNAVGQALVSSSPGLGTPTEAFRDTFGVSKDHPLNIDRCPEGLCTAVGYTYTSTQIYFTDKMFYSGKDGMEKTIHLVIHELGHSFNGHMTNLFGAEAAPYHMLSATQANDPRFPDRVDNDSRLVGFAGPRYNWQQSGSGAPGEEFADMFLGWTYNRWETFPNGSLNRAGRGRSEWMASHMPLWVNVVTSNGEDWR
jgi:hypothetical protein